jgi:3-phenylpropionate/trans-cinnamate dioxygenase ferredoxin reductase subunit
MRKTCRVTINDQVFSASCGDILLDAARKDGVDIPHDCGSGHCGICRVRVLDGLAIGGECGEPGTVRACQARIMSDLHLRIESLPEVQTVTGYVSAIRKRAPDVVEVKIEPSEPLTYLPGQYLRVQFRGFPVRCYSPTAPMEDISEPQFLHLQVQRMERGHVSSALGSGIREGHQVRMQGPFGSAFLRPASQNRLVLIAGGTGFAPAWSIAVTAIRENPRRCIVMVVGAQTLQSLYMVNALCRLARFPDVAIIPVVETPHPVPDVIRIGNIIDYIPTLSAEDSVHVCGPLPLVEAVSRIAAEADATCYSVPFVPQHGEDLGMGLGEDLPEGSRRENPLSRALDWFSAMSYAIVARDGRAATRRSQDRRSVV